MVSLVFAAASICSDNNAGESLAPTQASRRAVALSHVLGHVAMLDVFVMGVVVVVHPPDIALETS